MQNTECSFTLFDSCPHSSLASLIVDLRCARVFAQEHKAIAAALDISIKTFDFHKKKLFNLLRVDSKMDLLKLSIKHKIVA